MNKDEMIKCIRLLLAHELRDRNLVSSMTTRDHSAVASYAAALASLTAIGSAPAAVRYAPEEPAADDASLADGHVPPNVECITVDQLHSIRLGVAIGHLPDDSADRTAHIISWNDALGALAQAARPHFVWRPDPGSPSGWHAPEPAPPVDSMRTACLAAEAVIDAWKSDPGFRTWWMSNGGGGIAHYHDRAAHAVLDALAADAGPDALPDPATPPDETIDRLFAEDAEARSRDDRPGAPSEWLPSERIPTAKDVQQLRGDLARMTARKDEAIAERDQTAQDLRGIMAQRDRLRERAREDEELDQAIRDKHLDKYYSDRPEYASPFLVTEAVLGHEAAVRIWCVDPSRGGVPDSPDAQEVGTSTRLDDHASVPDGWVAVDDIDMHHCVYGIQNGRRCVWLDGDGVNVLEDPHQSGSQAVPVAAVLHVIEHARTKRGD